VPDTPATVIKGNCLQWENPPCLALVKNHGSGGTLPAKWLCMYVCMYFRNQGVGNNREEAGDGVSHKGRLKPPRTA